MLQPVARSMRRMGAKMRRRSSLAVAITAIFTGSAWLLPAAALASTKCMCNNGTTVESMDDEADDYTCNDACSMLGGGRVWDPELDRGVYVNDEVVIRQGAEPEREAEPVRPKR